MRCGVHTGGLLLDGTEDTAIHNSILPKGNEPVIVKRRIGAFHDTDLMTTLKTMGVRHLGLSIGSER
jgi:hypothetical protein